MWSSSQTTRVARGNLNLSQVATDRGTLFRSDHGNRSVPLLRLTIDYFKVWRANLNSCKNQSDIVVVFCSGIFWICRYGV
jgi:hypothetical protein